MSTNSISIYRFTSFESLINIVQSQALSFVSYDLWDDPYEGFIFKALQAEEGRNKIQALIKKHQFQLVNIMMLDFLRYSIHGQSWSKCSESDAMWRIYSNNKRAVRIETDRKSIGNLTEISFNEIGYADYRSLEEELLSLVDGTGKKISVGKVLLKKRTAFKHEEEVRLLTKVNLDYLASAKPDKAQELMNKGLRGLRNAGKITEQQFSTGWENNNRINKVPRVVSVDFSHIECFIKSVLVHPQAPSWYVDTVQEYCKRNGLSFLGKSELYSLSW